MLCKQVSSRLWQIIQYPIQSTKFYSTSITQPNALDASSGGTLRRNNFAKNFSNLLLPPGFRVTYCYTEEECNYLCEKMLSSLTLPAVVGCDAEWVPFSKPKTEKIAVLQLCVSSEDCYIFHLSQIGRLPDLLKKIIFEPWIVKVGVGVEHDLIRLSDDYCSSAKLRKSSFLDIGKYADDIGFHSPKGPTWSLKLLVENVLKSSVDKDNKVRLSNWKNFPLTEAQLFYAATDAYVSLQIFKSLDAIRRQQDGPISAYPYLAKKFKAAYKLLH